MKASLIIVALLLWAVPPLSACGGSPTAVNGGISESVTVATSATSVCPANTNRSFILIQNTGSNTIFCAFGATATSTNGFQLTTGQYFQAVTQFFVGPGAPAARMLLGSVSCIASGGSSNVAALEN